MKHQDMAICLWFNNEAEQAAQFYTSIFADSGIINISRFGKEGFEHHGQPEGTAMSVDFRLNRMKFIALNGNAQHGFNESASIVLYCDTQVEIDHYWSKLADGGKEQMCGLLKDRYGVSWQILPSVLPAYVADPDPVKRHRVASKMFEMVKFEIDALKNAYDGD